MKNSLNQKHILDKIKSLKLKTEKFHQHFQKNFYDPMHEDQFDEMREHTITKIEEVY